MKLRTHNIWYSDVYYGPRDRVIIAELAWTAEVRGDTQVFHRYNGPDRDIRFSAHSTDYYTPNERGYREMQCQPRGTP